MSKWQNEFTNKQSGLSLQTTTLMQKYKDDQDSSLPLQVMIWLKRQIEPWVISVQAQ